VAKVVTFNSDRRISLRLQCVVRKHKHKHRGATGVILVTKRPIMLPLLQRSDLLCSLLKGNSQHVFVAIHFCTNDVTQHKLPHDLTRQIFLGSHCRMCYVRNASGSQGNGVHAHSSEKRSFCSLCNTRLTLVVVRSRRCRSAATQTTASR
jgi:hypothetical protein